MTLKNPSEISKPTLTELALTFARMGATAFGGPAAHIAVMEETVVRRKEWLSKEEFLDLLGATNLIPGPNSTEMAIHIGYKLGGWRGLTIAGSAFIIPAFLVVWAIAWFYVKFGSLPAFQSIFHGVLPVIIAVIVQATWSLSRTAIKDRILAVFAVLALGLYLLWGHELLVLFLIAVLNLLIRLKPKISSGTAFAFVPIVLPEQLFLYFAKIGSVLFGSGYVLIAFLQNDLVNKLQWISQQQLVDAIVVGQFTPGPVFTTATFIGYLVSGNGGAILATLGIFTPAFVFVALSAPIIPTLRRSRWVALLLDGLNVASLSIMAGAAFILGKETIHSVYGILIFILSLLLLVKFKTNSVWLILFAGALGFFGLAS